jgi:hypothetical protein
MPIRVRRSRRPCPPLFVAAVAALIVTGIVGWAGSSTVARVASPAQIDPFQIMVNANQIMVNAKNLPVQSYDDFSMSASP